jgi:2-desacetyl-2-hydroxyethyl bacteriochlorophyllide A dehydrogenase
MKSVVCEKPWQLKMKETDLPKVKSGEALIRVRRVGMCGTDLHAFKGEQPYFSYPRVLGHEISGEVAELGKNSYGFKQDDRVAIIPYLECGNCIACRMGKTNCCTRLNLFGIQLDGGMSEYLSVPLDHLIKSEILSLDQLAMAECLSIGAHAVRRAQIEKGEIALIIGAGPVGMAVMQSAKEAGAKVVALDIVEARLTFCRDKLRVDYVIHGERDPVKDIESITNGDYPTLVFDATGNAKSMMKAFNLVSHGGRLILVSLVQDNITFFDPDFHRRELTLVSSRNATREDMEHIVRSLEAGKMDGTSFITHRASLDQVVDQFESWLKPETGVIKAVVEL